MEFDFPSPENDLSEPWNLESVIWNLEFDQKIWVRFNGRILGIWNMKKPKELLGGDFGIWNLESALIPLDSIEVHIDAIRFSPIP